MWEKKQKNCDVENPLDEDAGDQWDHVALAAESRLVVSMVPGKRTGANTVELLRDFKERTGEQPPTLITSDEYGAYATVLGEQYSDEVTPPRTGKPGRPPKLRRVPCPALVYATVHKHRKQGRVINVTQTLVYGTQEQVDAALAMSTVSKTINTSFVERYNATDRNFNARKARKTYRFSKDRHMHEAASWIGITVHNFCRPHRGLTIKRREGVKEMRTPAMAAGLTKKPMSLETIMQTQMFPEL